ncbi:hypothetical protein [Armatimonas rosea]|uniref:Uncharacterized protein n=1 Tax=Armatimonas rosea TaxID=685828 RepID=A0A7W9W8R3_ARMRO|nr:hypothetical protein [Armatimonas rosea]MBB6052501.1 hypothetical protein [Armatimonas rosea]
MNHEKHEKHETDLIDIATGERRGLRRWLTRRRLTPPEQEALTQTQALFAELGALATDAPPELPDFMTEAARLPRKAPLMKKLLLPGLAALALLTISALPLTRPLVQAHGKLIFGGMPTLIARQQTSANGMDYRIQLSNALSKGSWSNPAPVLPELRTLIARYPEKLELRALALNVVLGVYRDAARRGSEATAKTRAAKKLPPEDLALALADADAGARLAPENALFPLLKTSILLAAGHDTEALAAFRDAMKTTGWDDYRAEILQAQAYANQQRNPDFGGANFLASINAVTANDHHEFGLTAMLFPSTFVVEHVAALEQAHKNAEGWALRDGLFALGTRLQKQATSYLGSSMGASMALRALSRPGGAPSVAQKFTGEDVWRQRAEAAVTRFQPYAIAQGHPERLNQASTVIVLNLEHQRLFRHTDYLSRSVVALGWWWGSLVVLFWTLWLILFGGLTYGLNQTRRVREGKPLHPAVAWGVVLSLVGPFLVGQSLTDTKTEAILFPIAALALLALMGIHLYKTKKGSPTRGGNLVVLGVSLLVALGIQATAGYLLAGPLFFSPLNGSVSGANTLAVAGVVAAGVALAFPLIMALVFALLSRKRRLPASVGIVRGIRRHAVPLACVLVLVYAALTPFVAALDAQQADELALYLKHEGQFYARLAGARWD